jgi:hypothetical protein
MLKIKRKASARSLKNYASFPAALASGIPEKRVIIDPR